MQHVLEVAPAQDTLLAPSGVPAPEPIQIETAPAILKAPRRFLRKTIAGFAITSSLGCGLAVDTVATEWYGDHPDPTIQEVLSSKSCLDASKITLYESGMGERNAARIATIGSIAIEKDDSCAVYVDDGDEVRPKKIAEAFTDYLLKNTKPDERKRIVLNGMSTGGLVVMGVWAELQKRDDLPIEDITLILDSTPSDSEDIKYGWDITSQLLTDHCELIPGGAGTNFLTKSGLYVGAFFQGKDINEGSTQHEIDYQASGMELPLIRSQFCAIRDGDKLLDAINSIKQRYFTHIVYLRVDEEYKDSVVRVDSASNKIAGRLNNDVLVINATGLVGHEVQVLNPAILPAIFQATPPPRSKIQPENVVHVRNGKRFTA